MKWHPLLTVGAALALAAVSDGQTTNATSNIAGFQRVTLSEGRNFVALPVIPSTNTLAGIVNTNLPANVTESSASAVDLWDQAGQTLTNRSWVSSNAGLPGWRAAGTFADNSTLSLDINKGFIVTIRTGQGSQSLPLAGFVATNAQTQSVQDNGYTLAGSTYPVPVALADSGLIASGFVGGSSLVTSDSLIFFNPTNQLFEVKIWYDTASSIWRDADGTPASRQIQPGEGFLVRRRSRGSGFVWTNPVPSNLSGVLQ